MKWLVAVSKAPDINLHLLTFHDSRIPGTSHGIPDHAMWYGWAKMQRDLTEIKELAVKAMEGIAINPRMKDLREDGVATGL
jgi:hypothetical protein